jgi:hypothetical protein
MPKGYCNGCDYSLEGVTGLACPECGRRFDPDRPETCSKVPLARRRRLIARTSWVIIAVLFVMIVAPRRLERLQFSWPSPDGATATTQTRWELVAPSFMPFRYPHWTGGARQREIESNQLEVVRLNGWVREWFWPRSVGGFAGSVPHPAAGFRAIGTVNTTDILPENFDKLTDLLVYGVGANGSTLISSRIVRDDATASK